MKSKRYEVYSEKVCFGIIVISCLSSAKLCLRFLLICFAQEIKGFYQSFLGNEVDFRDTINVSPNILAKNWNSKKLRNSFVDERALITTTLISSCHWKTLVPFFLLAKEKTWKHIFNTNSGLSRYRTEKQIMAFRIFNDKWCYLFIASFAFFNKHL